MTNISGPTEEIAERRRDAGTWAAHMALLGKATMHHQDDRAVRFEETGQ
jgi:hypothetical protein